MRDSIVAAGGSAEAATIDASDESAVEAYAAEVAERAGRIDIAMSAVGVWPVQGVPLLDLPVADFLSPITQWTAMQLVTSRAVGRHMRGRGAGVILLPSASPSRLAVAGTGGFGVACAAVEGLSRTLAAELGPAGVRVVCHRPHRILETSRPRDLETPDMPMPLDDFRAFLEGTTMTGELPSLSQVAATAAFAGSAGVGAMTGTVLNITAGASVD